MKRLLIALAGCFLVLVGGRAEEATEKKDPVAEKRAKYARHSAEVLKIVEPVKVTDVFYYKDGGTIGIELTDAKNKKHLFCLDGGGLDGTRPRNLHIGVSYPGRPGGKMVEWCGPEESALYGVMLRWANNHPQKVALFDRDFDLNYNEFGNLWEIRAFLLKLDSRFAR